MIFQMRIRLWYGLVRDSNPPSPTKKNLETATVSGFFFFLKSSLKSSLCKKQAAFVSNCSLFFHAVLQIPNALNACRLMASVSRWITISLSSSHATRAASLDTDL